MFKKMKLINDSRTRVKFLVCIFILAFIVCITDEAMADSLGNACPTIQGVTARQTATSDPISQVTDYQGSQTTGWATQPDSSSGGIDESDNGTDTNDCSNETSGATGPNKMKLRDRGNRTNYLHIDTGVPNGLTMNNLTLRLWGSDDRGNGSCRGRAIWSDFQDVYFYVYSTDSNNLASITPTIYSIAGIVTSGPNTPNGCTTEYIDFDLLSIYNLASTPSTGNFEVRLFAEVGGGIEVDDTLEITQISEMYVDWAEQTSDLINPSSSITAPADGTTLNSASPDPFTVSGSASDNVEVSGIEVSINGGAWQGATCSGCPGSNVTWTYSWTLPADGSYTIQSRATDTNSNVETPSAGNTVTLDRTAPTVTTTVPTNGATGVTLNSNVTINWNENIDCATVNTTNITSDSPGWTLLTCSAAQAVFTTSGQTGTTTYNVNVTSAVTDANGNPMSAAYPFSYTTADTEAPTSSVTNPADGATLNSSSPDPYTISGSASDNTGVSGIEISINGGGWQSATCSGCPGANVTWTYAWTLPADGSYTIQSRATDTNSNIETPSADNTVTIDTTGPSVTATVPTNGATGVTLNSNVTINWNENIDCGTINTSNITSTSPGWTLSTCSGAQAVFTTSGQTGTTAYNVNVTTAVNDANGNAMAASYLFSYTTADTGAPTSSVTNPADGAALNSSLPDPFTITGSASDNVTVSGMEVSINGGAWQAASCTGCPGANITWTYSWTLPADGSYTIQSRATDSSSNVETPGAGNTVTIDRTAPSVSSSVPTNGATAVVLNSNVTINFNENIDCASVNTTNITSTNPGWTFSTCSAGQAIFNTGGQSQNTTYNVTVTTAVTDVSGNPLAAAYPFSYTTEMVSDTQNPSSTITDPVNAATLNSASPDPYTISGTASDNYQVSLIEVSINGGAWQSAACSGCPGANVSWTYSWTLQADGSYTIRSRATDSFSNAEIPSVGSTITLDRTAPSVSSTSPVDTATAVPVDSIVTIGWNDNVDCSTVNAANIISDSPGWAFYSCNNSQAVFTTLGQALSTTYNVTVSTAVTDMAGNAMAANYLFSYTTAAQLGQELVINPNFDTGVNWNVTLESTESGSGYFQYDPLKSQTADGSGSVQAHEQGQNFTVLGTITQQVFAPGGSTINNVSIWTEHATSHDTTGDVVTVELQYSGATIPDDGEINVPLDSDVTINFGKPVDCATINTANVTISSGGWALFDCTANQVTFTTGGQTNNTTYTVTVTTNVTDVAGNTLISPFVFSYTTIP